MSTVITTLKGYDAFRTVFRLGNRQRINHLLCYFLTEPAGDGVPGVAVGFTSVKTRTKVARNRNIRRLRELFRQLKQIIIDRCTTDHTRLRMVLLLDVKERKKEPSFQVLKEEMKSLLMNLPLRQS